MDDQWTEDPWTVICRCGHFLRGKYTSDGRCMECSCATRPSSTADLIEETIMIEQPSDEQISRLAVMLVEQDRLLMETLVATRRRSGLSQEDIAAQLGISPSDVQEFERSDADPRLSTIRRYALAVGVTVTHTVAERAASVACRDCGGRPTSTCDRCGADVPYSENAGALAWLLRRRQREQWNTCPTAPWITRQTPTPDAWDLALWLDRAGARV